MTTKKYLLKIVYKNGDIKKYYCDYYKRKNGLLIYYINSNRINFKYSIPYGLIEEWTAFRVHSYKNVCKQKHSKTIDQKQIPKKAIFDFNSSDVLSRFHCTCGKIIWVCHDIGTMDNNDAPNYCSNCGQKFDWDI